MRIFVFAISLVFLSTLSVECLAEADGGDAHEISNISKKQCRILCTGDKSICQFAYYTSSSRYCELSGVPTPDVGRKGTYSIYSTKLSKWLTTDLIAQHWPFVLDGRLDSSEEGRLACKEAYIQLELNGKGAVQTYYLYKSIGGSTAYHDGIGGNFLCRKAGTGFFKRGPTWEYYSCSATWQKCKRQKSWDAKIGKKLKRGVGGSIVAHEFIWESGGRVDELREEPWIGL